MMAEDGPVRLWVVCLAGVGLAACSGASDVTDSGAPVDAGNPSDAGNPNDAGPASDAGTPDAGTPDAGTPTDAGPGTLTLSSVGMPEHIQLPRQTPSGGNPFLEVPPAIVAGGWRSYLVGALETYTCPAPWSLVDNVDNSAALAAAQASPASCTQNLAPVVDNSLLTTPFTASSLAGTDTWRRNYNGTFSAQLISGSDGGSLIVAVNHCENKGEHPPYAGAGVGYFPSSFAATLANPAHPLGTECLEADGCYFASVGVASVPFALATNWGQVPFADLGPIVWPSAGYLTPDGGSKLSNGPRHPSSIAANGYLYVFYIDHRYSNGADGFVALDVGDRRSGLKVARAALPHFEPGQFKAYFNGAFSEDALPQGFTASNMLAFAAAEGPRSTPLFGGPTVGSAETARFSVARIRGTTFFVGVEEYVDYQVEGTSPCPGAFRLALRSSQDLVHWSARVPLYGCVDALSFHLHYPTFVDEAGWANDAVDAAGFYVLGTSLTNESSSSRGLYRLHVSLSVAP